MNNDAKNLPNKHPLDKQGLARLLARVIGRPENIPSPPSSTVSSSTVRSSAARSVVLDSPYSCSPSTWGTSPVIAGTPCGGQRRPAATRAASSPAAQARKPRKKDLRPCETPTPRGLLT